jgi:hypothetical protein
MKFEEVLLFIVSPGLLVDCRVEMVVPPFTALFPGPLGDVIAFLEFLGDLGPVIESVLGNQSRDGFVFLNTRSGT